MYVHRGHPGLDGTDHVGVTGDREIRVDAALHTDLGCAGLVRLPRPFGDLPGGQRECVGVPLALGECAEPAAGVADVGEVDVAVDHEGDVVTDRILAQPIGKGRNGIQRSPVCGG